MIHAKTKLLIVLLIELPPILIDRQGIKYSQIRIF